MQGRATKPKRWETSKDAGIGGALRSPWRDRRIQHTGQTDRLQSSLGTRARQPPERVDRRGVFLKDVGRQIQRMSFLDQRLGLTGISCKANFWFQLKLPPLFPGFLSNSRSIHWVASPSHFALLVLLKLVVGHRPEEPGPLGTPLVRTRLSNRVQYRDRVLEATGDGTGSFHRHSASPGPCERGPAS